MPRTAVAVRHVPFEDLGILGPLLTQHGYQTRYVDAGIDPIAEPELVDADLLVVLGGPIGVGDVARYPFLADEIQALGGRLALERPTLGVCLGAQLVARALGAQVTSTGQVEIGYAPLTLTRAGEESVLGALGDVPVLHWHGDQFTIPAGARHLAQTPGFPYQAFEWGNAVLGLQFHLEADHSQLERWLIGHAHELAAHRLDPHTLRAAAQRHGPDLAVRSRRVFHAWLDQVVVVSR
ncbi:glutamine amidotransferase [Frankia sp. AgPm24]|uniref:glutamine amidotransferase n=1 Tax=Frankia sp. AgPm24 TaxID=631128 RepID=UPI00200DA762|nr:glutamine amidotransferase [Frankia sp. AgPm24]MCK9925075.1 glutamine amidotransferase [Frankia sp. AgPm24]